MFWKYIWFHNSYRFQLVTLCHPGLTYILISDIRALWRGAERHSARTSEIKNVGSTWMAMNT